MAHSSNRIKALDIIRACAVFLVIGSHATSLPAGTSQVLKQTFDLWISGGWVGVDLFFVLSGFLVSGLLFREYAQYGEIMVKHFIIRRGLKIYPSFYLLIGASVLAWIVAHKDIDVTRVIAELLYFQNYHLGVLAHTWSLAVEEHFYILLPITLLFFSKKGRRRNNPFQSLPRLFLLVAVVCLGLRLVTASLLPFDNWTNQYPTHLRIDSLAFGALISYVYYFHRSVLKLDRRPALLLGLGGLVLLSPAFLLPLQTNWFTYTIGFTLFYLASGMILVAALNLDLTHHPIGNLLAFVGFHSYSIYLWHLPVKTMLASTLDRVAGISPLLSFVIYFVGACLFGIAMARIVEFPVLRIRDRLFPSRSGSGLESYTPATSGEAIARLSAEQA